MHTLHRFGDSQYQSQYVPKKMLGTPIHCITMPIILFHWQIPAGLLAYGEQLHISSSVDGWNQKVLKYDFEHFRSSEQHIDASI